MPNRPPVFRPINAPVRSETDRKKDYDKHRPSSSARGYGYKWKKAREQFLQEHPLCVHCRDEGLVKASTIVDHKIPHKGDQKLFWDRSNWQALCKKHHDRKTATEDSDFASGRGRGS